MCGILGGAYRTTPVHPAGEIEAALRLLAHRGPDAEGIHAGDDYFLAHRRLSILDLDSRANQPMSRDHVHISFNGEIYNYLDIRKRLEKSGVRFTTTSDTEVVLRAYQHHGTDFLNHLEGMFALGIWDETAKTMLLARDRFGEKPLYYSFDNSRLLFASELPPLEALAGAGGLTEDERAIGLYFHFSYIPAPYSPFRQIRQLEPGHWLEIDTRRWVSKTGRYYEVRPASKSAASPLSLSDACADLRRLLARSVKDRLIASDVPVAVFLSGGLDSSIVTALAASAKPDGIRAYSIAFPEDAEYDESGYARAVAACNPGVRHTVIPVTERDLAQFTEDTLSRLGEPYADSSLIPTAYLCSHVQEKVALGGDAADELFGGYGVYAAMQVSGKIPAPLKQLLARLPNWGNPHDIKHPRLRALALFLEHLGPTAVDEYLSWRSYAPTHVIQSLGLDTAGLTEVRQRLRGIEGWSLSSILAKDIAFNLPNDMLKKVDLASMFHSKEVRLPYLDTKLVEFSLSLPDAFYINKGVRKYLLRKAFCDIVPGEVLNKGKQGFLLPIRKWFKQGRFKEELGDLIDRQTCFDRASLSRLVTEHAAGARDHSAFLWTLLVYLKWREQ